jgi:tripartite-type tricarboxylate transporter receptor subunit TctC
MPGRFRFAALLAALLFAAAAAAEYPERPVRILVGYPPGGGTDLVARLVAQPLGERWGQPIVVENRPGAAAIIATEAVVKAKPDGYVLLMAYATELAVNPATFRKLPYDPLRDLAPIARLGAAPLVMAVHPSLPAQNVAELVALAKARPGALSYSSSGQGSVHQFAGELFKLRTGADIVHIPYKGSGPATADAVSGQVQVTFASVASVLRFVQSGRLRALAVTSPQRSPQLAAVPTMQEAGVAGVQLTSWYGLLAPAGTPAPVLDKIAADLAAVMASPALANGFSAQGLDLVRDTPAQFAAFIREEGEKYARIAKAARIEQE